VRLFQRTTLVSVACAAAMGLGSVGTAGAAIQHNAAPAPAVAVAQDDGVTQDDEFTQQQIDEFAAYLEAIFEGTLIDANGNFDYEATREKFGAEFADAVKERLAEAGPSAKPTERAALAKRSFMSCVLEWVGLGGLAGVGGEIALAVKKKAWKALAVMLLREAAKRGIKIAARGGVAGMAGALAVAGVKCSVFG
jgi:hypothetical protein